jgi:hypothetical protein
MLSIGDQQRTQRGVSGACPVLGSRLSEGSTVIRAVQQLSG